jgi:TonB family protein
MVVVVLGSAALVPAASHAGDDALAVRLALVVGNRGEAPLPSFGEVLSDRLMADYLTQWDPHSDNPEIRELFALRGLSEVTRQATRLAGGGTVGGSARVGAVVWRLEVDVNRVGGEARFAARIFRNEKLISAPMVRSRLGQKAIVSTTNDEDATFLFVVLQADDWSAVASRLPAAGPGGGSRQPAASHPKVLTKVNPDYPDVEKAERRQGVVVLALRVDTQGLVSDARVVRSLAPAFDEAALAAVRQWRFEPARRDGEAVEAELNITINFVPG